MFLHQHHLNNPNLSLTFHDKCQQRIEFRISQIPIRAMKTLNYFGI